MKHSADVIIVGGGMVGAALAASLGQAGMRVVLVEGQGPPEPVAIDDPFDLRISSLNLGSCRLLEAVGAWPLIPEQRRCAFTRIEASDEEEMGAVRFDAATIGLDGFGHFVENRVIRQALWQRLRALSNVTIHCHAGPTALHIGDELAALELDSGQTLTASLVVGADGAGSRVRELAGIRTSDHDYDQRALIVNVRTCLPQQDVSWQRFTAGGPQAMLPLPGPRASLVWYGKPDLVRERESMDDETLRQAVEQSFPRRLGGLEAVLGRGSFPIRRQHARHYVERRLALVGDAAHVIHPLAGQGLNLGLQDVTTLSAALTSAHATGDDPGSRRVLGRYALIRRPQVLAMIAATEAFHQTFTGPKPLRMTGTAGLALANQLGPVKSLMMRFALGLSG